MTSTDRKKGIAAGAGVAVSLLWIAAVAAGCAKSEHPAAMVTVTAPATEPTPVELEKVTVEALRTDPATIRRDQAATATVRLAGAPAGTILTLAWFAPDGWLAFDEKEAVAEGGATFSIPSSTFEKPGDYHGSLDAGAVHLADTTLTVSG